MALLNQLSSTSSGLENLRDLPSEISSNAGLLLAGHNADEKRLAPATDNLNASIGRLHFQGVQPLPKSLSSLLQISTASSSLSSDSFSDDDDDELSSSCDDDDNDEDDSSIESSMNVGNDSKPFPTNQTVGNCLAVTKRGTPSSASGEVSISPMQYLEQLFAKHGIRIRGRQTFPHHNQKRPLPRRPSQENMEAYDMAVTNAVRTGNLEKLKELHSQGYSLSACNPFGESLLHISCRRGNTAMVKFMTTEAGVNPRVMDDMGRTAFHDVCWSPQANLDTMDALLDVLPPIGLLLQDARGHSAFEYAPKKHWKVWVEYLQQREHIFVRWIQTKRRNQREQAAALAQNTRGPN